MLSSLFCKWSKFGFAPHVQNREEYLFQPVKTVTTGGRNVAAEAIR
jgi:hypothetical protein